MTHVWITIAVLVAALAAEWLHARRVARMGALAFAGLGARTWTKAAPALRVLAAGALCWGGLTLLSVDGVSQAERAEARKVTHHVLVVLDASPSMMLSDAGPNGRQRRGERAAELVESVFSRLDMETTRVSVVAFYTDAKPVVVDTSDLSVVTNILRDLPLTHAFKAGPTNMYAGVKEAAKIAKDWPLRSTMMLIVSDGDTVPDALPPGMPPSIADVMVLGVGPTNRTSPIAGHASRQDATSLRNLATRLRGSYHDGNARHIPSTTLASLRMLDQRAVGGAHRRLWGLIATGVGASIIAILPLALALFGRRTGPAMAWERTRDEREANEDLATRASPRAPAKPTSTTPTPSRAPSRQLQKSST